MNKTVASAVAAVVALAAPAWAADKGAEKPPAPRKTDEAGVLAWIDRYIEDDGTALAVYDDDSALLIELGSMKPMSGTVYRFWIRAEMFNPMDFDDVKGVRSFRMLYDGDCVQQRVRVLAADYYGSNNLKGEELDSADGEGDWSYPRPDSVDEMLIDHACGYVAELAKIKEAKAAAKAAK